MRQKKVSVDNDEFIKSASVIYIIMKLWRGAIEAVFSLHFSAWWTFKNSTIKKTTDTYSV